MGGWAQIYRDLYADPFVRVIAIRSSTGDVVGRSCYKQLTPTHSSITLHKSGRFEHGLMTEIWSGRGVIDRARAIILPFQNGIEDKFSRRTVQCFHKFHHDARIPPPMSPRKHLHFRSFVDPIHQGSEKRGEKEEERELFNQLIRNRIDARAGKSRFSIERITP